MGRHFFNSICQTGRTVVNCFSGLQVSKILAGSKIRASSLTELYSCGVNLGRPYLGRCKRSETRALFAIPTPGVVSKTGKSSRAFTVYTFMFARFQTTCIGACGQRQRLAARSALEYGIGSAREIWLDKIKQQMRLRRRRESMRCIPKRNYCFIRILS